jgi:voltage-gated sodium channel
MTQLLQKISNSRWFQNTVIVAILLAGAVVGIETYGGLVSRWLPLLHVLDYVILWIFTLEAIIKIGAQGRHPERYFRDPWNVFDFLIVVACWLPYFIPAMHTGFVAVFRLARILRVLRLVHAMPQLKVLVDAMLKSIPSMGYVGVLLFLLFYIYGAMGVFMFGGNNPAHFGNLHMALVSLFQIVTLEGWADIMYVNMFGCDHPEWGTGEACKNPEAYGIWGAFYFVSFVLIGTMIVLNLFIGVIMNSMEEVRKEQAHEDRLRRKAINAEEVEDEIDEMHTQLDAIKERLDFVAYRLRQGRKVK